MINTGNNLVMISVTQKSSGFCGPLYHCWSLEEVGLGVGGGWEWLSGENTRLRMDSLMGSNLHSAGSNFLHILSLSAHVV